jgi:hypothetical protein
MAKLTNDQIIEFGAGFSGDAFEMAEKLAVAGMPEKVLITAMATAIITFGLFRNMSREDILARFIEVLDDMSNTIPGPPH